MMHLSFEDASLKRFRMVFSVSPTHLLRRSLADIENIGTFASAAAAEASMVFPVPGGPYRSMQLHGRLAPVNRCGS
jgi:hypothetical protein